MYYPINFGGGCKLDSENKFIIARTLLPIFHLCQCWGTSKRYVKLGNYFWKLFRVYGGHWRGLLYNTQF